YYDNRSAAVVITADDWTNETNRKEIFINFSNITRNLNMWLSVGIITNFSDGGVVNWSAIQTELDKGLVEADSHSKYHDGAGYTTQEVEVNDSKEAIIANLDLPSIYKNGVKEYVWGWIEPHGTASSEQRTSLGNHKYLADRSYLTVYRGVNYSDWDTAKKLYNATSVSLDIHESDPALLNNTFDKATSVGEIYHPVVHPYNINLTDGSLERRHFQYISNRTNIWYAGFGQLYAYHYTGNITSVSSPNISINYCVNNYGNFYSENIIPELGDCGQNNITYPANGTILSKDANTTTDVSWIQQSSQNSLNYSVYLVNSSGRFYVNRTSSLSTIINFSQIDMGIYTLQVAPFDGRYNGTDRNISINISQILLAFVNQTNPAGQTINETNSIRSDQNLTIMVNATNVGGSISSVWIIIWQTVASAGNILWQGLLSLIGGLWQVQVPVNSSYPTYVNYTVFVNDSMNNTVQIKGNFTTFGKNISACGILNSANTEYYLTNNITSAGTCLNVTANNVTIDGNGYWITYGTAGTDYTYGIVVDNFNFTVVKNARITEGATTGLYKSGIYFNKSSNGSIFNNMINTSGSQHDGIYLFTMSDFNSVFNNTINITGPSSETNGNIHISSNSNSNNIANNTILNKAVVTNGVLIELYSASNTLYNNKITMTGTTNSVSGMNIQTDSNRNLIKNNSILITSSGSADSGILFLMFFEYNTNNTLVDNDITATGTAYGLRIMDLDIPATLTIDSLRIKTNSGSALSLSGFVASFINIT
ncbi:MAG: hypothetical protein NT001_01605, partial [Candidatus Woesearchaeota archaeon]|nr:hypothetical protein [Candidatus Woesearchaeota archaeon]